MSGGEGPMEGISELLRCYICMERLSNATICPHCSKLGCFACIRRWVTDNRSNCPHCRNALTQRDLIKIPLFDDLGQVLDNLHAIKKEVTASSSPEQAKCNVHHEKVSVYCETCKDCICHECALWSQEHHGHTFKPLDVIKKKHVEILQRELIKLKERMKIILSQVQQVERKIEGVKINKSKTKKELAHIMEKMCHQLDDTAKGRIVTLNEFRHALRNQALEITKESHDIEKTIIDGNISSLIDNNGDLKSEVSAVVKRLLNSSYQLESLPTLAKFINEVVPEYDSAIFRITSFHELQRKGEEVYSEPLVLQGLVWRLKVYPNGHKEEIGNYLAVFVELAEGYSTVNNYQYCIEMLYACTNKSPHKNHFKEYASEFADGESWGYRKYYELSRLHEDGFLKDDTLVLKFSVRAPSYYQKFQDQTHYLDKVVKERDALKQQLESSKQQLSTLKSDCKTMLTDRHQSTSSHTIPSQHDSHAPLSLHSSQHMPHRRSHSHSAPHGHQRRDRNNRLDADDSHARSFISHPPISQHRSPSLHTHSSPKRPAHYPPTLAPPPAAAGPHGEARVVPSGEAYFSSSHTHLYPGRRRSSEESPEMWKHIIEQRRKSADPVIVQPCEYDPRVARSQRTHGRRHQQPRTQPSLVKVTPKFLESSSSEDLEAGFSQHWDEPVVNPADITITLENDESERNKSTSSSSTLIDSGSPPRETKKLSVPENKRQDLSQEPFGDDDHKDMMSLSGLAAGPATIPRDLSNFPLYHESSNYFGEHQEDYPPPLPPPPSGTGHQPKTMSKHEQVQHYHGLSQPTNLSPPKSRYGKSLTDLTSSNISLMSSQQFLSQSVADFQHMHDYHRYADSPRHVSDSRHGMHEHRYTRTPHSQLHRMSSDSHLNKSIPGLQKSIISALSEVKEEVEQRKQQLSKGKKTSSSSLTCASQQKAHHSQMQPAHHMLHKSSHLQQRHVQATMVRGGHQEVGRQRITSHKKENAKSQKPSPDAAKSRKVGGSSEERPSERPAPAPVVKKEKGDTHSPALEGRGRGRAGIGKKGQVEESSCPHTSSRHLVSAKKSNSTSSLNNLSQIL